jgi:hypothetical protein
MWKKRPGSRPSRPLTKSWQFRPRLEALEDRLAPAVLTVTNNSDTSSPSAGASQAQLFRTAMDALLVAEGIHTRNNFLIVLGTGDFLFFTNGLSSGVQSKLLGAFSQHAAIDLAFLSFTSPGPG